MAFASDSTTAPQRPLLPLTFRPAQPVADPRSADELLEEIRRAIEAQEAAARPELPPEPLLTADVRHGGVRGLMSTPCARGVDIDTPLARHAAAPLPSLTSAFSRRRAIFGAVVAPMALAGCTARSETRCRTDDGQDDARLTLLATKVDREGEAACLLIRAEKTTTIGGLA